MNATKDTGAVASLIRYMEGQRHDCLFKGRKRLCKCGCGNRVTTIGKIFLWGHYAKWESGQNPRPKLHRKFCKCGCGKLANYGKKFIDGHGGFKFTKGNQLARLGKGVKKVFTEEHKRSISIAAKNRSKEGKRNISKAVAERNRKYPPWNKGKKLPRAYVDKAVLARMMNG